MESSWGGNEEERIEADGVHGFFLWQSLWWMESGVMAVKKKNKKKTLCCQVSGPCSGEVSRVLKRPSDELNCCQISLPCLHMLWLSKQITYGEV